MFIPSKYQRDIFDFVQAGSGSGIVNAVAGSGKTTTIVQSLGLIPSDQDVIFLAFNKSIARELQSRVPANVKAATFHSQGFAAWRQYIGGELMLDERKTWRLINEHLSFKKSKIYGGFIHKMVGYAKNSGMGYLMPDTFDSWWELYKHYDVFLDSPEGDDKAGLELAQFILSLSNEQEKTIDYDDMLYLPMLREVGFPKRDVVFVDESQDTNGVQVELLGRMLAARGRLIAVGDPHQAIYGFRGADSNAMENIAERFHCTELPLSVSYRCSRAVVEAAQEFVPHIESHEGAHKGTVKDLGRKFKHKTFKKTDAILCRNTAPLVSMAYDLIGNRVPCQILGRDIGRGLATLVDKMESQTINELDCDLREYRAREMEKFMARDQESKAQAINDKVSSLLVLVENMGERNRTVSQLKADIQKMFTDKSGALTLATVHKSKGLEFNRVFILDRWTRMPCKWAKQPWQQVQEDNLIYVAYTRSRDRLNFITME